MRRRIGGLSRPTIVALAAFSLLNVGDHAASAQVGQEATSPRVGIRHALTAALVSLPKSDGAEWENLALKLWLKVRVSDHSQEADFFGIVAAEFSAADHATPAVEKPVWQAARCHQDRGFPRIKVMGIEGFLLRGAAREDIAALPRRIGKVVPSDEIMVVKRPSQRSGGQPGDIVFQAQTQRSLLVFELRLRSTRCEL